MAYLTTTASGQPVLILKEGTSRNRGKEAQRNNIMAARVVGEVLRSTLGPRGMDKMLIDSLGDITITNDGAAILEEITSPFTLYPGEVLPFYIKYKFAVDIQPGTYTIYSTVKPAP